MTVDWWVGLALAVVGALIGYVTRGRRNGS